MIEFGLPVLPRRRGPKATNLAPATLGSRLRGNTGADLAGLAGLALFLSLSAIQPASAQGQPTATSTSTAPTTAPAAVAPAVPAAPPPARALPNDRIGAVLGAARFHGEVAAILGNTIFRRASATGTMAPLVPWRWASVTKQVTAVLVMQEVVAGRIDLDRPVATYLPDFASPNARTATVRQLLQHRAGLPNPDATAPTPDAFPAYYQRGYRGSRDPLRGYCAGPVSGPPGGQWSYNNCDYIVLGALLERVTGQSYATLVRSRIAERLRLRTLAAFPTATPTHSALYEGKPEPAVDLASYGAAAGLYGTVFDMLGFDRALLDGRLLPAAARETLWRGDPTLGFMALGQWVFTVPLKGCATPVRIVERRGAIGGVEVRNFILPDQGLVLAAFTDRSPFDFGEVWQGKGFSYDLLSAAAC